MYDFPDFTHQKIHFSAREQVILFNYSLVALMHGNFSANLLAEVAGVAAMVKIAVS